MPPILGPNGAPIRSNTPQNQSAKSPVAPVDPSLELRVNSVADAKAVVQNSPRIVKAMRDLGFSSLEIVLAEELSQPIMEVLVGVFNIKVWYKKVRVRPGNKLFELPHLKLPQIVPAPKSKTAKTVKAA